ncbi:AraC family transcriptional regulator [Paenibacillus ginsengarvi]|uniref:AraC family transcriptional regulator n=2 Tax=Paenibacillus ginsengarvi TaxID=400777 RepID=A0A3B0CJS7_9BACL|nr:AraC family transcriptional regulator [Paenibacillus ginsengarvi]
MPDKALLENVIQVRTVKRDVTPLIGFEGAGLDDEKRLFKRLNETFELIAGGKRPPMYLVILMPGFRPFAAVEAPDSGPIPNGMTAYTIPADDYVVFGFEKAHVGLFWSSICTEDNQKKYNIDLAKPRFEIGTPELETAGLIEWYIPIRR